MELPWWIHWLCFTFMLPEMILVAWLPLHHSHYKLKTALTRVESLFKYLLIWHSKGRGGVPHTLQLMSVGEQNLQVKTQSTNRKWIVANEHRRASPLNSDSKSSPSTYTILLLCRDIMSVSLVLEQAEEEVNNSTRNLSLRIILIILANKTHFHHGQWLWKCLSI